MYKPTLSEHVLRKIHDYSCTFRSKYLLRHFFDPNSPEIFYFISKNSDSLFLVIDHKSSNFPQQNPLFLPKNFPFIIVVSKYSYFSHFPTFPPRQACPGGDVRGRPGGNVWIYHIFYNFDPFSKKRVQAVQSALAHLVTSTSIGYITTMGIARKHFGEAILSRAFSIDWAYFWHF